MRQYKSLQELFSFGGFKAENKLKGRFGDPKARIVTLIRQKKLPYALAAKRNMPLAMIKRFVKRVTWMLQTIEFMCAMKGGAFFVVRVKACA